MNTILAVAIGGALGALARLGVNQAALLMFGSYFPYGTMIVNISGSFLMGAVFAALTIHADLPEFFKVLIVTGFLGAFTTFSAFSLDSYNLWERGDLMVTLTYIAGSVLLSLAALFAGLALVRGALT